MSDAFFEFLDRHSSFIITTHDPADADGLGAEKILFQTIKNTGKKARLVNSNPVPEKFSFIDSDKAIETWESVKEELPQMSALIILDTADEYNIGELRGFIPNAAEVFVIDHHEPNKFSALGGYIDNTASSVSELAVEIAQKAKIKLNPEYAMAAYAGIVYDTGFFAYPKTTARTFSAALSLVEAGVKPYDVYRQMNENSSAAALLLQQKAFSTMKINNGGRVAIQTLRKEDLQTTGAYFEDAENFINIPLKSRDIEVSILVKENKDGQTRCSLRSKGNVNVSNIAQGLGGGGHVSAAGFKSSKGPDETLAIVLSKVSEALGNA